VFFIIAFEPSSVFERLQEFLENERKNNPYDAVSADHRDLVKCTDFFVLLPPIPSVTTAGRIYWKESHWPYYGRLLQSSAC